MIETLLNEEEKPIIVVLQDNTESVIPKDSAVFSQSYIKEINKLKDDLNSKYDTRFYVIGSDIIQDGAISFADKETDLSSVVSVLKAQFSGRNLGAVILASDGLYNKGLNPVYAYKALDVPVHVIPLGDTIVKKDLKIAHVRHNEMALTGNILPIEILVNAQDLKGQSSILKVTENEKTLIEKRININSNNFSIKLPFSLNANSIGIHHYKVKLEPVGQEENISNNNSDFFINVKDERSRILILANAPHPDIAYLKNVLESSISYEVEYSLTKDFITNINEYDLVIFHNIPSLNNSSLKLFENSKKFKIPFLLIMGTQTSLSALKFNVFGVSITDNRNNINDVQATLSNDFSLFNLDKDIFKELSHYPPLKAPFGQYTPSASVRTLLNQKIGSISTKMPLIYFNDNRENRIGVIAGEGIWRWALYESKNVDSKPLSRDLMLKSVQYLLSVERNDPFTVKSAPRFAENESVDFFAELINPSGELTNEPDVLMVITDENGKEFEYTFSRVNSTYSANLGVFPTGVYSYSASTALASKKHIQKGSFSVYPLLAEKSETIANHQLLYSLANKTGGGVYYPKQINDLIVFLEENMQLKPIIYSRANLDDLINKKLFFILLICLLTMEWFLRKRSGTY